MALAGQLDVVVHCANCFHVMGGGIAKSIREQWPQAYEADLQTQYGDIRKLGDFSVAKGTADSGKPFSIINLYGQYDFGADKQCYLHYGALSTALHKIANLYKGKTIGLPYGIGCGLAGGDWPTVNQIINEELHGMSFRIVRLP